MEKPNFQMWEFMLDIGSTSACYTAEYISSIKYYLCLINLIVFLYVPKILFVHVYVLYLPLSIQLCYVWY